MTKPKTKYPIEAFGPELMQALLLGGRQQVVIPFANTPSIEGSGKKRAHTFQRRIHTLRQRMREENHPQYTLAARAKVSIFWGARATELDPARFANLADDESGRRGAVIVIRPHDSEFVNVLKNAGITEVPKLPAAQQDDAPPPVDPLPSEGAYDDLLDEHAGDIPSISGDDEPEPE